MDPDFTQKPGFTDQLPSDTDTYLKKIQDNLYSHGIDYVDLKTELGDVIPKGVPVREVYRRSIRAACHQERKRRDR